MELFSPSLSLRFYERRRTLGSGILMLGPWNLASISRLLLKLILLLSTTSNRYCCYELLICFFGCLCIRSLSDLKSRYSDSSAC